MGYYSPVVTGATNGNDSEVIGMRVWINGIEVPAFSCWDTQYAYSVSPRSSDFRRVLFQATLDPAQMLMSCAPGTLLP
jgi:hypothetical protein